jgi:sulfur-carrier protein
MATVSIHYWAGAKAAAGVERETVEAATMAEALAIVGRQRSDPRFARILNASSILVKNQVLRGDDLTRQLTGHVEADVLPPFAGG